MLVPGIENPRLHKTSVLRTQETICLVRPHDACTFLTGIFNPRLRISQQVSVFPLCSILFGTR